MEDVVNQDNEQQESNNLSNDENSNVIDSQDSGSQGSLATEADPASIKKRLGLQAKKHAREMRAMQDELIHLRSQMNSNQSQDDNTQHFQSPGQPSAATDAEEDRIRKAVRFALDAKDAEKRKSEEAEQKAHVQKQYKRLQNELDSASDKYDDFDDVVRGDDATFTPAIRDALLLVDNPADVAYALGKNRDNLQKISKLHPYDQAREVTKLAFALMSGGNASKGSSASSGKLMGNIKSNPAHNSTAINGKTPVSSIRARMKAGTFK